MTVDSFGLNDSYNEMLPGKHNALRLFLSYTKDGGSGLGLAKALQRFIDNTPMNRFFDVTDIAPGYRFDDEIVRHINESTVIAIHSDSYSGRYWCQREMLTAKECDRPIVVVDILEDSEDRRFPFSSNTPSVRADPNGEHSLRDLLRILCSALLETIRFHYSSILLAGYKQAGWVNAEAEIRSRPPEVSDIRRVLAANGYRIACKYRTLVYPEPPVHTEELDSFSSLGIRVDTPLTYDSRPLNFRVGISISDPPEADLIEIGQGRTHLAVLSQELARHLLAREATLVYGGDLRPGGFTEFIFDEARVLQSRLQRFDVRVENFIAWPIHRNDPDEVKRWKAEYRSVARMTDVAPPPDVGHLIQSVDQFLPPTNVHNWYVWSRCLTEMREKMISSCTARICAGGRASGYRGRMPGVLEEIVIALRMKRPLYLIGGFGGITASVCALIRTDKPPEELTGDWQVDHIAGYKEFLDFASSQEGDHSVDYFRLVEEIRKGSLNNGLSDEDNNRLFTTPFAEEALHIVLRGLEGLVGTVVSRS